MSAHDRHQVYVELREIPSDAPGEVRTFERDRHFVASKTTSAYVDEARANGRIGS